MCRFYLSILSLTLFENIPLPLLILKEFKPRSMDKPSLRCFAHKRELHNRFFNFIIQLVFDFIRENDKILRLLDGLFAKREVLEDEI